MGISVTDSKLGELARMISGWPGLVSGSAEDLIDDSLVLLEHLADGQRLVDVGSGGGLPGLPLKIAQPSLAVTLIEADQDKAAFLVQACARLHLEGVEVLARRAGEVGQDERYRETFDVAGGRGGAPMAVVVAPCRALVRSRGTAVAAKTGNGSSSA